MHSDQKEVQRAAERENLLPFFIWGNGRFYTRSAYEVQTY